MAVKEKTTDRISRLRQRYLVETPWISIDRAKYFTESWKQTGGRRVPQGIRVALAMRNVYRNMGMHVDDDHTIAGTWTEHFLGVPVDVEKGMFNNVLAAELTPGTMAVSQVIANIGFVGHLIRRYGLAGFISNVRTLSDSGIRIPSPGLKTMDAREINPFRIRGKDRDLLLHRLLPYWKGRTIADMLETRLRDAKIYPGDMAGLVEVLPNSARLDSMITIGASIGVWQGHLILDHETHVRRGLLSMREEVAEKRVRGDFETDEEGAFLESMELAIEGAMIYAQRLAKEVEKKLESTTDGRRAEELGRMLKNCRRAPMNPPEDFRQAVQSYWTVKTAVELAVPFNVHAPGRLDQYLYPYYRDDISRGRISDAEAKELMEELFLKIMSHNLRPTSANVGEFSQRYEGSEPVTFSGVTPEGTDATNALTYVMLDAAADSKASLNFVVRLHENSPEALTMKLAELYQGGTSSISLQNDATCIAAMTKRGFSREDALGYAITGCNDVVAPGKTGGEAFSAMLMCRVLDMTLRNGDSKTPLGLLKNVGVKTGDPAGFSSFEQFMEAYLRQGAFAISRIADAARIRDRLYAEKLPAPHISAFMGGCLDNKKDVTLGGAIYDFEGILFICSIANTVDSLYVIKKLVFDRKEITFKQLIDAMDNNFKGHEDTLKTILALEGRWGNGDPESDDIAHAVMKRLFGETYQYETFKGGKIAPFINSMTVHAIDGRMSLATPDGRLAGMPFAPGCSPYHVEKHGITGVLRSVAAIDFSDVMGCAVNIRMHPSAIGTTESSRRKWISLVKTYFKMGGEQLQPTVVSTEVLRAAQKTPDNYRDVIVKVGGYSAYFTDLGVEMQNEIISRTEHSMA
jgi:trans-4-hydroxy-L-proline dehydratase